MKGIVSKFTGLLTELGFQEDSGPTVGWTFVREDGFTVHFRTDGYFHVSFPDGHSGDCAANSTTDPVAALKKAIISHITEEPNMYDYIVKVLEQEGNPDLDKSLRDLPVDSECGRICKRIVDTTRANFDAIAFVDPDTAVEVYELGIKAVMISWRG
jgi:hypothetical protein